MRSVAIDGPAGAGKSTVARRVAERLGLAYIDTGAMYRVVALAALERGADPEDGEMLGRIAREARVEATDRFVRLDGRDVSVEIRGPRVTSIVPAVAAHPEVRAALLETQRGLARDPGVVMEGRDIGSVVLPHAALKIFLTADLTERARRRSLELGTDDEAAMVRAMDERDRVDSGRSVAPLTRAPDAVDVDSTGRSIEEVVDEIVALARQRGIGVSA